MQLFKVTVEYADLLALAEWRKKIKEDARNNIAWSEVPYPPQIRKEVYAAVWGEFGTDMIQKAGEVALKTVIGKDPASWKEFEAIVVSAESVGMVGVQEIEEKGEEDSTLPLFPDDIKNK